jgi:hypothetical protein
MAMAAAGGAVGIAGSVTGGVSGAANGGNGNTTTYADDCSDGVTDPSDSREQATSLAQHQAICVQADDQDWFYVDTPDDGKAHLVDVDIRPELGGGIRLTAIAADGSEIGSTYTDNGAELQVHVSVGPATRTWFEFSRVFAGGKADVSVTYSDETDAFEPNNTRATASNVDPGKVITAMMLNPYRGTIDNAPEDWYAVNLEVGEHTFALSQVPEDVKLLLNFVSSSGVDLASASAPNAGATFSSTLDVTTAGRYFFSFAPASGTGGAFFSGKRPDRFSTPYSFRID